MERFVSWYNGLSPRLVRFILFFIGGLGWSLFATHVLHFDFGQILVVALIAGVLANYLEGSKS